MSRGVYAQKRIFVGRLPRGADLVGSITRIANEEGIKLGSVTVHGAVSRVAVTVLDQQTKLPIAFEREEGMEIATVGGTVSQFKGRSLARLNGLFVGADGGTVGGTIALGTVVHACEAVIVELEGGTLSRDFDAETGLPLWKERSLLIDPER